VPLGRGTSSFTYLVGVASGLEEASVSLLSDCLG
jgi:hypothetical protein